MYYFKHLGGRYIEAPTIKRDLIPLVAHVTPFHNRRRDTEETLRICDPGLGFLPPFVYSPRSRKDLGLLPSRSPWLASRAPRDRRSSPSRPMRLTSPQAPWPVRSTSPSAPAPPSRSSSSISSQTRTSSPSPAPAPAPSASIASPGGSHRDPPPRNTPWVSSPAALAMAALVSGIPSS